MFKASTTLFNILPSSIGVRIINYLIERPFNYKLKAEEKATLLQSEKFEYAPGKYAYRWGKGPIIIFVHGWGGVAGQWYHFVKAAQKNGFTAIALDITAHGESKGDSISFSQFSKDLKSLISILEEEAFAIVGHSAGGLMAMAARYLESIKVKKYVCISTPNSAYPPVKIIKQRLAPPEKIVNKVQDQLALQFRCKWEDITQKVFFEDPKSEFFFIYDKKDKYLNGDDLEKIKMQIPSTKKLLVDEGGHVKILNSDTVIREVMLFLRLPESAK